METQEPIENSNPVGCFPTFLINMTIIYIEVTMMVRTDLLP